MEEIKKLSGEPNEYYNLFIAYVMNGPSRSLQNFSNATGISIRKLYYLAKKFNWKKRATKYDNEEYDAKMGSYSKKFLTQRDFYLEKIIEIQETMNSHIGNIKAWEIKLITPILARESPDEYMDKFNKLLCIYEKYLKVSEKINKVFEQSYFEKKDIEDIQIEDNEECDEKEEIETIIKEYEKFTEYVNDLEKNTERLVQFDSAHCKIVEPTILPQEEEYETSEKI